MAYYLIICRSLTYAQRTARVLERAGIAAHVMRAPKSTAGEGCTHGVRVAERWLTQALQVLKREGLAAKRVFMQDSGGNYSEVPL